MGLTAAQWDSWKAHIDFTIRTRGEWVGLCTGDGEPYLTLPSQFSMTAAAYSMDGGEIQTSMVVASRVDGLPIPMVDILGAEGLGSQNDAGALVPAIADDWMIVVCRPGGIDGRSAFCVTHAEFTGEVLTIATNTTFGHDLTSILSMLPAPSIPATWRAINFRDWAEDAAGPYSRPRTYAPIEMATVADGYSVEGPADVVVRRVLADSLAAVDGAMGWTNDPMFVVAAGVGESTAPRLVVRVADEFLWDTLAEPARLAGVTMRAQMWWPGDATPALDYGRFNGTPVGLITVNSLK